MFYSQRGGSIQSETIEFKSEVVSIAGNLKSLEVADQSHTEVLCVRAEVMRQVKLIIEVKRVLTRA